MNIRPAGVFDTDYAQDIALHRTRADRWRACGGFAALLLLPLLTDAGPFGLSLISTTWIGTINRIAILVIAVQGLNLLVGYAGQISLGHAAFMAVGAYSAALLARLLGTPFWLAIPLAALVTGGVGLVFGLPSLRVKGFYLVMATLAAQFIIPWVIRNPLAAWTNGTRPLEVPVPMLGAISFASDGAMYYIIVPLAVGLMLAARNIIRTRIGRAFISIRDNDLAAELFGINSFSIKLQAFFLSALYAGVAGALLAFSRNSITVEQFELDASIELLAMIIIGGMGYPLGALFGAASVILLRDSLIPAVTPALRQLLPTLLPFVSAVNIDTALNPILFGLALIVFLVVEPRGLAYGWEMLRLSWKLRPFAYQR